MIASGYQLVVRHNSNLRPTFAKANFWPELFLDDGLQSKSLVEISGANGSGKSVVLFQIMARAVLSDWPQDSCCEIIFIDLTHKFDVINFVNNHLKRTLTRTHETTLTPEDESKIIQKCLESITLLNCYSLSQFEIAFTELENLIWNNSNIGLLAIDGLDRFYWEDCHQHLQRMSTYYKKWVSKLQQLCEDHNLSCCFTVESCHLKTKAEIAINYELKITKDAGGLYKLNNRTFFTDENGINFFD
ncbi:DNA repair protein XRCC2 [Glossina fuscipes]|uniref:DNA repair protein XRCC2 n=1 Tax=Glossina fuscipes TaxID=7396 RepID=A0A8U0WN43_9MUSC|nr:DNA repair protein XRCC2 [Glossina fuscipes]XP_037887105.1 DNA repair protein XRCC2 [Glossina fuscipes]XP_037887106.1 DNA repair protein XRCC2 [Glossina fuscipes]XP_037887107.1 DNA repair protein XRCC2 [Glossina fuscipes]XP_037887108.1 DNA repair protein XRCC2 [Glossina fuscipes]